MASRSKAVGTVVFVDVDGVLNVGIRDPPKSPLNLTIDNVSRARCTEGRASAVILSVCERLQHGQACGGSATYSELVADSRTGASEVLLGRLADVLREAGDGRFVVLSSSWREPRYRLKVELLEERISHALGEPFCFDDTTGACKDSCPTKRLACIGDYVSRNCGGWQRSARVLVLEDFHISPLRGWSIDDLPVQGAADVEGYLKSRAAPTSDLSVLLAHTFDQWLTPEGPVQIGSGLSHQDVERAVKFFAEGRGPSEVIIGGLGVLPDVRLLVQHWHGQLLWRNVMRLKTSTAGEWVFSHNDRTLGSSEQ